MTGSQRPSIPRQPFWIDSALPTRRGRAPANSRPIADNGSALPGRIADARARVRLAKSGIAIFDVIEIDRPKRGLGLLQGRARLDLEEFVLEITARKRGDHLVALLRRVLVISDA